jgi:hypothetical protein
MPIQLTTAFNPGDVDAGKLYTQAKILSLSVDVLGNMMRVNCSYGYTADGVWVQGVVGHKSLRIEGQDFGNIMGAIPVDESIASAMVSRIYQWLLDDGVYSGIIVP